MILTEALVAVGAGDVVVATVAVGVGIVAEWVSDYCRVLCQPIVPIAYSTSAHSWR